MKTYRISSESGNFCSSVNVVTEDFSHGSIIIDNEHRSLSAGDENQTLSGICLSIVFKLIVTYVFFNIIEP